MNKLIAAALAATVTISGVAVPPTAEAQSTRQDWREAREDRREFRRERRGDRRDFRHERRADRREYRRDRREIRRDYRADRRSARSERDRRWGANDWRRYRSTNRHAFARGQWRAPFRYRSFRPGVRIRPNYFGQRFLIADPWRYHLPRAGGALRYVRHYDDVLLVDVRRNLVVRVYRNFFW